MLTDPLFWLVDLCIFVSLWLLGILAERVLLPNSCLPEQVSLGYGLGIGLFTWLLFLISWAGVPLSSLIVFSVFILLFLGLLVGLRLTHQKSPPKSNLQLETKSDIHKVSDIVGWTLFIMFGLTLFIVSIGLAYAMWDAMAIWSVKGYGIGMEQTIFAAEHWGAKGIAYPLNIPLAISLFFRADQDLLPGSKLLFPGFYISMLIGLRVLFSKRRLPAWLAWCAVFAIGTIPLLMQYSLVGYANVPFTYYYAIGIIWLCLGLADDDPRRILVGALLLTLSIWTRLEGLEFWFIAIISLTIMWWKKLFARRTIFWILSPALVIGGSWVLFGRLNHATTSETVLLLDALSRLFHGEFTPMAVYQILRFTAYLVFKTRVYGMLAPVAIGFAFIATAFNSQVRKDKFSMAILITGILTGLGVIFMYYLTSYDQSTSLLSWLGTGYDRMLFGAIVLLMVASTLILWQALAPRRKPA